MAKRGNFAVVHGIRDFQLELRKLDAGWETDFEWYANRDVARLVATGADARFAALPGVARKFAGSVKAVAQARNAAVRMKPVQGRRSPIPPFGAEFGGGKHGKGNPTPRGGYTTQFLPHRGTRGYGIYPTIRSNNSQIVKVYLDRLTNHARRAFPN